MHAAPLDGEKKNEEGSLGNKTEPVDETASAFHNTRSELDPRCVPRCKQHHRNSSRLQHSARAFLSLRQEKAPPRATAKALYHQTRTKAPETQSESARGRAKMQGRRVTCRRTSRGGERAAVRASEALGRASRCTLWAAGSHAPELFSSAPESVSALLFDYGSCAGDGAAREAACSRSLAAAGAAEPASGAALKEP